MLAPNPMPHAFDPSESTEATREKVMAALKEIRRKAATGRLKADSKLFKLKAKLTQCINGKADDAQRRARYLEDDAEGVTAEE